MYRLDQSRIVPRPASLGSPEPQRLIHFPEIAMNRKKLLAPVLVASLGFGAVVGSRVIAADAPTGGKPAATAAASEIKLPPGWTEADMRACMVAATPGKMQQHLAEGVGVWHGKNTMWMSPGAEPLKSQSTTTVTSIMDGRHIRVEVAGDMPGMGPYKGLGHYGYDNTARKFVSTWLDNHSTGIMTGTGELSPDGKILTWKYTYTCPLTKKPSVMRDVETITGPDTKTMEMFGADPKTGKEFRLMRIELTKK